MGRKSNKVPLAGALLLAAVAATAQPPSAQPLAGRHDLDERFAVVEHEYVRYFLGQFPVVATYLGGAAFDPALEHVDGRLRDNSPEGLQREDARLGEFRARFAALAPARLSAPRRIDRSVALAEIDFLLHQHQVRHYAQRALDAYVDEPSRGVDWQIQGMTATTAGGLGTVAEWQAVIARTRAVPAFLAAAERQLAAGIAAHNTPDGRMLRAHGLASTAANAEYFGRTLPQLAAQAVVGTERESLLKELQAAGNEAASAYRRLHEFVAQRFFEPGGEGAAPELRHEFRADRFALGAAEYDWALHHNLRVAETAASLYASAWPIVQGTRAQLIALARQVAASHEWHSDADGEETVRQVFAQLSQTAPRTDAEMLAGLRRTGERLVAYARTTGLFHVPDDYRLAVVETPPPLRASFDGAAYYPAPPFKRTGVGRFMVTPTGDDAGELRQEYNYASMPDLAAHEGFPGHDWHYKMMTEYGDQISPIRWLTPGAVEDSSSMWQDSMAAEGWGLYAEALIAEPQPGAPQGFYTPEEHLYQLRAKLYRDLRVRIDSGIHTGKLGFDQAVTLFSEVVDFLPGACGDAGAIRAEAKRASCLTARTAVARYARWPTQAVTYRLGRDQIVSLRKRAQQSLGARFSAEKFHLEFMRQGTIPSGYFAEELLRELRAERP